jgi:hypothetical protein
LSMPALTTAYGTPADGGTIWISGLEQGRIAAMSSVLGRRLSRLEQAASTWPDEPIECETSEEAKDILRTVLAAMGMAPKEIEARVNRRYLTPGGHVADLSPVEREQRLLAIRSMVADNSAAKALLEWALNQR